MFEIIRDERKKFDHYVRNQAHAHRSTCEKDTRLHSIAIGRVLVLASVRVHPRTTYLYRRLRLTNGDPAAGGSPIYHPLEGGPHTRGGCTYEATHEEEADQLMCDATQLVCARKG